MRVRPFHNAHPISQTFYFYCRTYLVATCPWYFPSQPVSDFPCSNIFVLFLRQKCISLLFLPFFFSSKTIEFSSRNIFPLFLLRFGLLCKKYFFILQIFSSFSFFIFHLLNKTIASSPNSSLLCLLCVFFSEYLDLTEFSLFNGFVSQ